MWMGSQILWLRIGILEKEWEAQGAAANADKVRSSGTLVAKYLLAVRAFATSTRIPHSR
jgi:hypothetical protein